MNIPSRFKIHSHVHGGLWLFVANEREKGDRLVQAHSYSDEDRNWFEPVDGDHGTIRLYNPSTDTYVFVSNDTKGGDRVVEAHPYRSESRNGFVLESVGDAYRLWNPHTEAYLFVSNDKDGQDYQVEAHPSKEEERNLFTLVTDK
jgi:hypothetical protein